MLLKTLAKFTVLGSIGAAIGMIVSTLIFGIGFYLLYYFQLMPKEEVVIKFKITVGSFIILGLILGFVKAVKIGGGQ